LVQRIIRAYDEHKTRTEEQLELLESKGVGNGHAKNLSHAGQTMSAEVGE
jgi:hypothetical protein